MHPAVRSGSMITVMVNGVPSKLPRIVIYMPPEVREDFEKLANYERRSLSQMALYAIEEAIRRAKADGKISDEPSSGKK
jgi:tartrate dehydratase alpha subunit/fumarate hydratase class I-like protein